MPMPKSSPMTHHHAMGITFPCFPSSNPSFVLVVSSPFPPLLLSTFVGHMYLWRKSLTYDTCLMKSFSLFGQEAREIMGEQAHEPPPPPLSLYIDIRGPCHPDLLHMYIDTPLSHLSGMVERWLMNKEDRSPIIDEPVEFEI